MRTIMFLHTTSLGLMLAGAAVAFTATVAIAGNSPPVADNFQPFMWEKPQVQGEPMTAHDLGMEDRVNPVPAFEGRAAFEGQPNYRPIERRHLRHRPTQ